MREVLIVLLSPDDLALVAGLAGGSEGLGVQTKALGHLSSTTNKNENKDRRVTTKIQKEKERKNEKRKKREKHFTDLESPHVADLPASVEVHLRNENSIASPAEALCVRIIPR